jgi:hypothetical protein
MKCTKCGADTSVDSTSSLCPACLDAQKQDSRFKLFSFFFIGIVLAFIVVIILTSGTRTTPSAGDQSLAATAAPVVSAPADSAPAASNTEPAQPASNWDYSTVEMEAGSKTEKVGCIASDNEVDLRWPYQAVRAELCFRTDATAYFHLLGDGQMLSGDEHGAKIRFGDGPARSFSLEQPADYSSNGAFIEPAGPVFTAARGGKTIVIEATYYDAGSQSVAFIPSEPLKLK